MTPRDIGPELGRNSCDIGPELWRNSCDIGPELWRNSGSWLLGRVIARKAYRMSRLLEEGEGSLNVLGGTSAGAYGRARIAVALGERERAMELLRQAGPLSGGGHADPLLEPLWDYPPFKQLLRPKG